MQKSTNRNSKHNRFIVDWKVIPLVVIVTLVGGLIVNHFAHSKSFNGRKVIYVSTSYGVGGSCSHYVYDKLKVLDYVCVDNGSINKLFVNADVERNLSDFTATGRTIYKVDADMHSTIKEIDTGNPSLNSNTKHTIVHIDNVHSVEVYKTIDY